MKYLIVMIGILSCFSFPAFGQQRIIVEKATGNVVDVGDNTLVYDTRFFDNLDYPNNPVPERADFRKYFRDQSGNIVQRPGEELKQDFDDVWQDDLISRVNASRLTPELKEILIEIIKNIIR